MPAVIPVADQRIQSDPEGKQEYQYGAGDCEHLTRVGREADGFRNFFRHKDVKIDVYKRQVVHGKKVTKKARVEATVLNNLTPISKAEICKILPDVSPTTVEAVLGAMVKTGSVKRIGAGRAARYIKA